MRSDNGAEFTAKAVQDSMARLGVQTLYIAPGSPWENGYVESLIGKLRDELLNGEIFYNLEGSAGTDRKVAQRVQPDQAAQLTGLSATGSRGRRVAPGGHSARKANTNGWTNIGSGTNIGGGSHLGIRSKAAQQAKASAGWHFTRLGFGAVWPAVGGEPDIYAVSR